MGTGRRGPAGSDVATPTPGTSRLQTSEGRGPALGLPPPLLTGQRGWGSGGPGGPGRGRWPRGSRSPRAGCEREPGLLPGAIPQIKPCTRNQSAPPPTESRQDTAWRARHGGALRPRGTGQAPPLCHGRRSPCLLPGLMCSGQGPGTQSRQRGRQQQLPLGAAALCCHPCGWGASLSPSPAAGRWPRTLRAHWNLWLSWVRTLPPPERGQRGGP